jgi:hypothetical protein
MQIDRPPQRTRERKKSAKSQGLSRQTRRSALDGTERERRKKAIFILEKNSVQAGFGDAALRENATVDGNGLSKA